MYSPLKNTSPAKNYFKRSEASVSIAVGKLQVHPTKSQKSFTSVLTLSTRIFSINLLIMIWQHHSLQLFVYSIQVYLVTASAKQDKHLEKNRRQYKLIITQPCNNHIKCGLYVPVNWDPSVEALQKSTQLYQLQKPSVKESTSCSSKKQNTITRKMQTNCK